LGAYDENENDNETGKNGRPAAPADSPLPSDTITMRRHGADDDDTTAVSDTATSQRQQ
jgi:hypothetical protein